MKIFATVMVMAIMALAPVAYAQSTPTGSDDRTAPSSSDPRSVIPAEMAARYAHARWSFAQAKNMVDLYPAGAADQEVQGTAVIACRINDDGSLGPCRVVEETPKNYGFGTATVDLFMRYCHVDPQSVDGGIQPDDFTVFTFRWALG